MTKPENHSKMKILMIGAGSSPEIAPRHSIEGANKLNPSSTRRGFRDAGSGDGLHPYKEDNEKDRVPLRNMPAGKRPATT